MSAERIDVREALAAWCNEKNIGREEWLRRAAVESAVAELIEAARWRDPIAEPAAHRQRVLVAYEAGRHVVVGGAVRWLHTPGDHDGEDEWELDSSSYVVKVLAWRPMPDFDRAALARVGGAS